MADQPTVTLNSGAAMPQLGFGVFQIPLDETHAAVNAAFESGYRSIDTAAMYGNEEGVAQAIQDAGLPREDIFVTTKLNNNAHGFDAALKACEDSLQKLGLDFLDLYLIHWPLPAKNQFVDTWKAFVKLQQDGLVRSIGVSNFQPAHLERIIDVTGVTPSLNQVECHPYLTQQPVREFDEKHTIATEAWSPIAQGGELLSDPVITSLADKYGKSPAQIVIRWHLDVGNVVIPKSVTPQRIRDNIDVFDFELDADDVAAVGELNRDERTGPDPDTFNPS